MSDPYLTMIISADTERIMGDAMIEARRAYYDALADYASPIDKPWNPDLVLAFDAELGAAYKVAYTLWEQAHEAANRAVSAWLATVT